MIMMMILLLTILMMMMMMMMMMMIILLLAGWFKESVRVHIQLFRERLPEKVLETISKGNVGGFEFTVLQRNLKEWHERPWSYVCKLYERKTKKFG